MPDAPYRTARIDELERDDGWSPIRQQLGVQSFGVNAWTAHEAGGRLIPPHDEVPSGHEELYLVTTGHATFIVGDDEVDAPAGTLVFVLDPAATRGAVAREADTTVVSMGGRPGAAYRPRSWERTRDVYALLDAGRPADARRILVEMLDQYEDRATVLFNLACAEAQLGEADAALEHLEAAVAGRPDLAAAARDDADLAPLRGDPRFDRLVSGG